MEIAAHMENVEWEACATVPKQRGRGVEEGKGM